MKKLFLKKYSIFLLGIMTLLSTIISPLQLQAQGDKPFDYVIRNQLSENKQTSTISLELQNSDKIVYQTVYCGDSKLLLKNSSVLTTTSLTVDKNDTYLFEVEYTLDGESRKDEITYKEENIEEKDSESEVEKPVKEPVKIEEKKIQPEEVKEEVVTTLPRISGKKVGIEVKNTATTDQGWFIFAEANTITGYLRDGAPNDVIIPETYENDEGVQSPILHIADNAFSGLEINSIVLNSNLQTIGSNAFANTKITDLSIPESVTTVSKTALSSTILASLTIGANVPQDISLPNTLTNVILKDTVNQSISFKGLTNLTSVTLSNQLPTIISSMFEGCASLQSIRIPSSVTEINYAFEGCTSLREVTIDASGVSIPRNGFSSIPTLETVNINGKLTGIEKSAFSGCSNLTTLNMQEGVGVVEEYAFSGCKKLQSVVFKDGTTSILPGLFYSCDNLSDLVIPSTVEKIEMETFAELKGLKNVTLAEGVKEIGQEAFAQCNSIVSLNIPDSITKIGVSAFTKCNGLENITLSNTSKLSVIGYQAFYKCKSLSEFVMPNSVTSVGESAFAECSGIKKLTLSSKLQDIGVEVFKNCTALESITFNEGLSTISEEAFSGCIKLNNIKFPDSLNEIKRFAFKDCKGLETISLNPNLKKIGDYAFTGNTALKSLMLNQGLIYLGTYAFEDCKSLATLTINGSLTSIGSNAFLSCLSLEALDIPATVTTIESGAFARCEKLANLTFHEGTTEIGDSAFSGIIAETITIPSSVTTIGEFAFSSSLTKKIDLPDTPFNNVSGAPWGALSATVSWEGGVVIDSCFYFEENNTGYTVTALKDDQHTGCAYSNDHRYLIIPETWQGKPVTKIGNNCFSGSNLNGSNIVSITIPDTVTSIGAYAFYGCQNLNYIKIPKSVISIGDYCFYQSNLYSIELSEGLEKIGDYAFDYSALNDITTPSTLKSIGEYAFADSNYLNDVVLNEGLETIGNYAFSYSGIDSINIPSTVINLGTSIFVYSESLDEVRISEGIKNIPTDSFMECNSLKEITIPASVEKIGGNSFYGCDLLETVKLTETSKNNSNLKIIEDSAFRACSMLSSINLLEGLKCIESSAFEGNAIENITIPSTVKEIAGGVFEGNNVAFKNVTFADGIGTMDVFGSAFNGCKIETVVIPSSMKIIYPLIQNAKIKKLILPEGVEEITREAFKNTDIEYLEIPGTIKNISNLEGGYYKKLIINEGVQTLYGDTLERDTYLEEVSLPSTLNIEGNGAFSGCSNLKKVTLAEGITELGDGTFSGCTSLSEIKLPNSLTRLSYNIFASCNHLTKINLDNITEIGAGAFDGCASLIDIKLNANLTVLEGGVFSDCTSLKEITIPNTIDVLSYNLFSGCVSLDTVHLPMITSIGSKTFENCKSLESIQVKEGLKSIGSSAFKDCIKLKNVTLPDSITEIGDSAFKNCARFTEIELPSKITQLSNSVFEDCSSLESVSVPSGVTKFGNSAFKNCVKFSKVTVPNGVTEIGSSAFEGCAVLPSMALPNALETIGDFAFKDCGLIDFIKLPDKLTGIGNEAFSNTKIKTLSMPLSLQKLSSTSLSNMPELKAVYIDLLRINCPYASNESFGTAPKNVHYKGDFAKFSYTVGPISNSHDRRINYQFDADLYKGLILDVTKPDGTKILGISAKKYNNSYVVDLPGVYEFSARTTTNDEFPYVAYVENDMGEVDISAKDFTITKELLRNASLSDFYAYANVNAIDRDTKDSLLGTLEANKTLDEIKAELINNGDVSEVNIKATSTVNKSKSTTFKITLTDEVLYKVDYQVKNNQGTGVDETIETLLVKNNGTLVEPTLVDNEDFVIKAWYSDDTFPSDKKWDFRNDKVTSDMVLYASYTQKTYGVDYVTGKESSGINVASKDNVTWNSKNLIPNKVDKVQGYVLSGWKCNDVSVTNETLYSELSKDRDNHSRITLKAVWKALENYTVRYELNGGKMLDSAPDEIQNMMYDEAIALPKAEKDHYKFKGWTYQDKEVKKDALYQDLANDETVKELVLQALWEKEEYEVSFEYKGNIPTQQPPTTVTKKYQETVEEPKILEPTGYVFKGWYKNEECTTTYAFDTEIDHTMTLYGKWELEKYEVVFHSNGGSSVESAKEVEYKTKVTEPSKPEKKGYTFVAWYEDETLKDKWDFNSAVERNMDLYAKWELQEYQIEYKLDGGENHSENPSKYTIEREDITLGNPTKKGFKFIGWTWDGQEKPQESVTLKKGSIGNIVYTAVWKVKTYEITFDSQGGSTIENQEVAYLGNVQKPSNPTRKGYTFKGWYNEVECITAYDFDTKIMDTKTLYGKWEEDKKEIEPIKPSNPNEPSKPTIAPETPKQEVNEKAIHTGDTNRMIVWISFALICGSVLLIVSVKKRNLTSKNGK